LNSTKLDDSISGDALPRRPGVRQNSKSQQDAPAELSEDEILWPEAYLPYQLFVLVKGITRKTEPLVSDRFDLSMREWRVLLITAAYPEITANEVADRLNSDKMIVSRAVGCLLRKGHLRRSTDPNDRRRSLLRLTQRGADKYQDILAMTRQFDHDLRAALSQTECAMLEVILQKLAQQIRESKFD